MQTLLITHRRMVAAPGRTHNHVGWVRLQNGTVFSRQEVLSLMGRGYSFETLSPQGHHALVGRVRCSRCGYEYLRTDPDRWRDDNLDMLPYF